MLVTSIEGAEGTVSLTAMVAATQAITGELTDTEQVVPLGRPNRLGTKGRTDLMDNLAEVPVLRTAPATGGFLRRRLPDTGSAAGPTVQACWCLR